MKFMLFAASALAATTVTKRQLSVVEDAISAISSGTTALRSGINSFSGLADVGALQDSASSLIDTINQGNSAVGAIATLGNEAAGLATPIQDLASLVSSTVDDLVSKKQTFVDAGVAGVVLTTAESLRDAANTFRTTTLGKVPENLQSLGNQLSQPISDALDRAVTEFTGLDSGNGGSGTTTTTGGETTTTTSAGNGGSYSTTAATTTGAATTTSKPAGSATTSSVATYTGAAIVNAANGYGAVAMAVLAGAAML